MDEDVLEIPMKGGVLNRETSHYSVSRKNCFKHEKLKMGERLVLSAEELQFIRNEILRRVNRKRLMRVSIEC